MRGGIRLSETHSSFIQGGVTIFVASCVPGGAVALGRALACRVTGGGRRLHVILARDACAAVLDAARAGGGIAAVFTQPSTHRSLQVKGGAVTAAPCGPKDRDQLTRQLKAVADEVAPLGFGAPYMYAYGAHSPDDLTRLSFDFSAAFDQTPGPGAGERVDA